MSKDIENLLVKYLTNESNSTDLDYLSEWVMDSENEAIFETFIRTHYEVRLVMNNPDIDSIKKTLLQKIKKDKSPVYKYRVGTMLKYAAIALLLFGLGNLYFYQKDIPENTIAADGVLIPLEEAVTIQLDNGQVRTLDLNGNLVVKDKSGNIVGQQSKSQLNYTNDAKVEKLIYNTLNVPRGKRFDLVLSDGTHVYLNAGTSLKYPVKFLKNSNRDVFITGEAYFDVAEDEDHPFIVHADDMNVEVLGTKFNVSHYPESENITTVLVEGSVTLSDGEKNNDKSIVDKATLLKPGFKADWHKANKNIAIENVDTRLYTAWVEGKLIFRNNTFKHIRNTLGRHYNVTIKNSNSDLDAQLFDATFDIETIHDVLEAFNTSYAIDYRIVDNEVIIN